MPNTQTSSSQPSTAKVALECPRLFLRLLKEAFTEWNNDNAPTLGAALAYYTIFSMAPVLIIAIATAGLIFGKQAAQGETLEVIENTVGHSGALAVQEMLRNVHLGGQSLPATILGFCMLLFGASGVFLQLEQSLNIVWKVKPRPGHGFMDFMRERLLSLAVVLLTGLLLLISLVSSVLLAAADRFWSSLSLPGSIGLWQGLNLAFFFVFITLLFMLTFRLLPFAKVAWRDAAAGAILAAVLFSIGKYLLMLYLGMSSTTSAFGAAGAFAVLLIWVYYSSQLYLLGAEFAFAVGRYRETNAGSPEKAPCI